ncbi:hypothetical protein AAFN86_02490 [Roseomonas sp. CAU 1739]|uniref:hypothetical protein n=1 Tax=Roseomonas sp. CAU 1739 TaxID=3140364 RepID=UPI00325A7EE7
MDIRLIEQLRHEELSILEELRATTPYQRLAALRQVLACYDGPPPVGAFLDALLPETPRQATSNLASVIALPGPRAEVA